MHKISKIDILPLKVIALSLQLTFVNNNDILLQHLQKTIVN